MDRQLKSTQCCRCLCIAHGIVGAIASMIPLACAASSDHRVGAQSASRCAHRSRYSDLAAQEGGRIAAIVREPDSRVMLSSDRHAVQSYVRDSVLRGNVSPLAALVIRPGAWRRSMWYDVFVWAFAAAMSEQRPIALAGAEDAVDALRMLTATSWPRETRVSAAVALRYDDKDLSRRVLLDEYAKFKVLPWRGAADPPTPTSGYLQELGVPLPHEIRSVEEMRIALRSIGIAIPSDEMAALQRLAVAANAYNEHIRAVVKKKGPGVAGELLDLPERNDLLIRIYQEAQSNTTTRPSTGEGLFDAQIGHSEDTIHNSAADNKDR